MLSIVIGIGTSTNDPTTIRLLWWMALIAVLCAGLLAVFFRRRRELEVAAMTASGLCASVWLLGPSYIELVPPSPRVTPAGCSENIVSSIITLGWVRVSITSFSWMVLRVKSMGGTISVSWNILTIGFANEVGWKAHRSTEPLSEHFFTAHFPNSNYIRYVRDGESSSYGSHVSITVWKSPHIVSAGREIR